MKVKVDKETCIGCGLCADTCPEVFEMNDENIAEVKMDPVSTEAEATCREASEICPVDAIEITE